MVITSIREKNRKQQSFDLEPAKELGMYRWLPTKIIVWATVAGGESKGMNVLKEFFVWLWVEVDSIWALKKAVQPACFHTAFFWIKNSTSQSQVVLENESWIIVLEIVLKWFVFLIKCRWVVNRPTQFRHRSVWWERFTTRFT